MMMTTTTARPYLSVTDRATLFSHAVHLKCHELRAQTKADLVASLSDLKQELAALRVAKVTGGAPGKLSKIKQVRLAIAQTLTVIRQKQLNSLREAYRGAKYTPLDLRQKKTRAIRRALTKKERSAKTARQAKKDAAFPQRKYALKA
jgi:large subunit ribosomal protein L35e